MEWGGCLACWRFKVVCWVSLVEVEEPTSTWGTNDKVRGEETGCFI